MSKTKELFENEREKMSLNEINKNTRELLYMCSQNFKGIFQEVQTICNQPKTKNQNHNGRN
jgi:hypothetical protein